MKFIILTILSTIIIFFVWNILKKIFFTQFYGNSGKNSFENKNKSSEKINQKVNWDAETVDYEEVEEKKSKNR